MRVAIHKAPTRKRTLAGPFSCFDVAVLPTVAFTARVARFVVIVLIVRTPGVVVRIARIAALRTVAYALVAFFVIFIFIMAIMMPMAFLDLADQGATRRHRVATGDDGATHRHCGLRQSSPGEGSPGRSDRCTRENISLEHRIRHLRRLGDLPKHVTRVPAVGHDHREAGARERAGPCGPDSENPRAVPIERQHAVRERDRCGETDDTGIDRERYAREGHLIDGLRACLVERGVRGVEVRYNLSGERRGGRPRNRAPGISERAGEDHVSGDGGIG